MPKITINGKEIEVQNGMTIIQACEQASIEIPRFCYHERLAVAGNCRMCLVKVDKMPKPVASCAQPVTDGMVVYTNTPEVRKMRDGVMEFLLINHPLDCPICDQAGECDLQDQALFYGKGTSRFKENKRAIKDKEIGPLIETNFTRCIHCTRCVRFLEDVAGTNELGAVHRGEDMEITTYFGKPILSELSGNIIDLCPVGALTSKPYAFKARSWELSKTESIDALDAVGSNIRIDSRGREVMRVLPRLHEDINEEWISDKTRFAYDALKYQRLDIPMLKNHDTLEKCTWDKAFKAIKKVFDKSDKYKVGAIAGDLCDVETMLCVKEFLQASGSGSYDCRQDGSSSDNRERASYIFNTTITGIENADLCLIIGSNPRHEAAILNARIRKARIKNGMKVALIGEKVDLTYDYKHLGENPWILRQITDGDHPYCEALKNCKNPILIIGSGVLSGEDSEATFYWTKKIASKYGFIREGWNGFNVLQRAASRVGGLDIGFIPGKGAKNAEQMLSCSMDMLFLLGADEIDMASISPSAFVVYIGHHGDKGANRANVVLPAASFMEKSATYVNLEGRVQRTNLAIYPPNEATEDWVIINNLAKFCGVDLGYKNIKEVRNKMIKVNPVFANISRITREKISSDPGKMKDFKNDHFSNPIKNFYMTDPITRASRTMMKCTKL
jgi:NADH-quinone oxidoreductase subunit G